MLEPSTGDGFEVGFVAQLGGLPGFEFELNRVDAVRDLDAGRIAGLACFGQRNQGVGAVVGESASPTKVPQMAPRLA